MDEAWAQATYISLAAGVMILSIVVLTGYAGQISLAQWALAGIGALIAGRFVRADVPVELAILLGILLTIPVGLVFALPALRTRGVNLAVVTLGLGFLVSEVVFANPNYLGDPLDGGTRIGRVEAVRHGGRRLQPPARLGGGEPRRLRAPRPARRQPPPVAHRPAAHRRAHQRAGRRLARHLGVRRQALRLRRRRPAWPPSAGILVGLPGPDHHLHRVQRVRLDQQPRLRRHRRPRLRARRRLRRAQRHRRPRHAHHRGLDRPRATSGTSSSARSSCS